MKTIGLIGGMSWESSLEYYRLINQITKERLGGWHSAKCLMVSLDFHEIESLQRQGNWDAATEIMINAASNLKCGGADFIVICTNTMHKIAPEIEAAVDLPLIHIADAAGEAIVAAGLDTVGLLGTKFTMEQEFYKDRLKEKYDLNVIIPNDADRQIVHDIIYNELVLGKIEPESKKSYRKIINSLVEYGAKGVILGCTEIPLLIEASDSSVPLFDTTKIHATVAVDKALE